MSKIDWELIRFYDKSRRDTLIDEIHKIISYDIGWVNMQALKYPDISDGDIGNKDIGKRCEAFYENYIKRISVCLSALDGINKFIEEEEEEEDDETR